MNEVGIIVCAADNWGNQSVAYTLQELADLSDRYITASLERADQLIASGTVKQFQLGDRGHAKILYMRTHSDNTVISLSAAIKTLAPNMTIVQQRDFAIGAQLVFWNDDDLRRDLFEH